MERRRGKRRDREPRQALARAALSLLGVVAGLGCGTHPPTPPQPSSAVLRVGLGGASATNAASGLRQLSQILTSEGLARLRDDGRFEPVLAEKWTVGNGGRSLFVTIRPGVK